MPHWALCAFCCHCKPQLSVCLSAGNRRWPWAHEGRKSEHTDPHNSSPVFSLTKKQNKKKQKFGRKSKVFLFLLQERGKAELPLHFYKLSANRFIFFSPFGIRCAQTCGKVFWHARMICKELIVQDVKLCVLPKRSGMMLQKDSQTGD